jgi:hypothetical protein
VFAAQRGGIMQTFLPFADFRRSAEVLDRQRLGKQRVEAMQILKVLDQREDTPDGWSRHPAVQMWHGYPMALLSYTRDIIARWVGFGYQDTVEKALDDLMWHGIFYEAFPGGHRRPPWLGDEAFHLSHRSNLLRKDPEHYEFLFSPDTPMDLPYQWPIPMSDSYTYYLKEGAIPDGPGKS